MSGFLQRVASSMLRPERAIHPTLGSQWSARPGAEPGAAEAIESVTEILVRPPSHDADTAPATQTERGAAARSGTAEYVTTSRPATSPLEPGTAIAGTASFTPLVAVPPQKYASALPANTSAQRLAEEDAAVSPHDFAMPPRQMIRDAYPELAQQPTFPLVSPQIPSRRDEILPLQPASLNPVQASRARRQAPSPAPSVLRHAQPAQAPSREPDEIEIHIGRIEVLAAQPRPAQTAPRPARKSLDLAEYLRRDRRPR